MNIEQSTKSASVSVQESGLGLAVGIHFVIGLLLVLLDPLFGESIWDGLRASFRLLPYIGLFLMLVAAALISRQRMVIEGAIAVHYLALLLPVLGCGLSGFLLLTPEPPSHMPGAGLAVVIGIILVFISAIFVAFSTACIFSLRQLRRQTTPPRRFWSKWTLILSAVALICFVLNITNTEFRNSRKVRQNAESERTVAHENRVVAIAFSPDSALVATGSGSFYGDKWIRIWDVTSGKMVQQLQLNRPIVKLVWSPDGKWLVAGCGEDPDVDAKGATLVWETGDWKLVHEFESSDLSAVAVSPDSESLAVAVSNTPHGQKETIDVMLYELDNGEVVRVGNVSQTSSVLNITALVFTPDKQRLIAGGSMGLAVWNLPIGDESPSAEIIDVPGQYPEFPGQVASMAITVDGTELICATRSSGLLHRYSVSDLQRLHPSHPYQLGHLPPTEPMMVISDEGQVVVAEEQWPVVQCLSWPNGNVLRSITPVGSVSAIAISDNAAVLAIGTSRRVRLHDGHTGEFLRELIKP